MGKELAPRVYDSRISEADAQRRCGREIKKGATLSAVVEVVQSRRSYGVEATDESCFYRRVFTGMLVDGKIVMRYHYRTDGRVGGSHWGIDGLTPTAEWPACAEKSPAEVP